MSFIHENFMLQNEPGRRLYHEYAADEPILDYHNHLIPQEIAENRRYENLAQIWLGGDHYKWRALRANGVEERLITGDAPAEEKFQAWAATVPQTLRNPLYHWTHLELSRYFGIDELLSEKTAAKIWDQANARLGEPDFSTHGILKKFKVRALCTTDDPADSLSFHEAIAKSDLETRVYPTYRPDKAFAVHQPETWKAWLEKLGATSNVEIRSLEGLKTALKKRHDDFHAIGGRLSDHGMNFAPADFPTEAEAGAIFDRAFAGQAATAEEQSKFGAHLLLFTGILDAEKGWTKQLHLGAQRNNNSKMFGQLGADTGYDSIGDWPQAGNLSAYLDRLASENALPKVVLYNLNPADNYVFATMIGNFQGGGTAGKIQFGSGWWFLDQKEAMEWQINALSNNGLLSRFIGMLTDSRSFLSFPRHEYFRRILCNLIGQDIVNGEIPEDYEMVGDMVRNICYQNAKQFLGLEVAE